MKPNLLGSLGGLCALLLTPIANAALFEYTASLSGANEPPIPNASPGTGFADVFFNDTAQTLEVKVAFSGLLAGTTASHIHAPTAAPFTGSAGVATTVPYFPGFPLGVTAGSYDHTFSLLDLATYNASFVTAHGGTAAGAEAALISALNAGESYLNIHTTQFPGGEISGYLGAVPDPAATGVLLFSVCLAMFALRRKHSY